MKMLEQFGSITKQVKQLELEIYPTRLGLLTSIEFKGTHLRATEGSFLSGLSNQLCSRLLFSYWYQVIEYQVP